MLPVAVSVVAITTAAVTFAILAAGLFFVRPETPLSQFFATSEPQGLIARRLLPLTVLLLLVLGWLRITGERRGLYEGAFGTALLIISLVGVFTSLICWTAFMVKRVEGERRLLNHALLASNQELKESLRQSELILNHARELICKVSGEGNVMSMSAASQDILGFAPSQLIGRKFCDLHSPEDRPQVESALRGFGRGLEHSDFIARGVRRDNQTTLIEWSAQGSSQHRKIYCVGREALSHKPLEQAWSA